MGNMSMEKFEQIANQTVAELLDQWPETAEVFHRNGMACVGCAVAPFYLIADVIEIYKLSRTEFLTEMIRVINTSSGE